MAFLFWYSVCTFDSHRQFDTEFVREKLDEGHCLQGIDFELLEGQIRSDTSIHVQLSEQCFETCLYRWFTVQRGLTADRWSRDFRFIENIFVRSLLNRLSTVARISARVESFRSIDAVKLVARSSRLVFQSIRRKKSVFIDWCINTSVFQSDDSCHAVQRALIFTVDSFFQEIFFWVWSPESMVDIQ